MMMMMRTFTVSHHRSAARTKSLPATLLFLCFMSLVVALPAAAQNSWQGIHPPGVLDLWSNAGEWSLGVVPDGSTDILIGFDTVGGDTSFTNQHTLTIGAPATLILFSGTTVFNSGSSAPINNAGALVNSGFLSNIFSGTINSTGALTNNGFIRNEGTFNVAGTIDNPGTIEHQFGHLTLVGDTTLQGGGTVSMRPGGGGTPFLDGTHVLTNVDNTIQGEGQIGDGAFGFPTLINQTAGTINANNNFATAGPSHVLTIQGVAVTNAGLMEATNGGTLFLDSSTILSNTGSIVTDAKSTITNNGSLSNTGTINNAGTLNGTGVIFTSGTVNNSGKLENAVVTFGGTINNTGIGGAVEFQNGSTINGGILNNASSLLGNISGGTVLLDGSTIDGALTIQGQYTNDSTTQLNGTIINQGTIRHEFGHLTLVGDTVLQGGGTVSMSPGGGGTPFLDGTHVLTNVDNTIQGEGQIGDGAFGFPTLINQAAGTINANNNFATAGPSHVLAIQGVAVTNAGLMEATNGGTLFLDSSTILSNTGSIVTDAKSMITNNGSLSNTGTINNAGTLNGTGVIFTSGMVNNSGQLENVVFTFGGTINNTGFGAISLAGGSTINGGTRNNAGGQMVYYVVTQANPENKQSNNVLVKRGKELHEPDRMYLNPQLILFVEPVGPNSKVAQLITQAK